MKKCWLGIFFLIISEFVFAEVPEGSFRDKPFYEAEKGDYVLYLDSRGENPRLIGIQYIDDEHYKLREFDYTEKKNTLVTVKVSFSPENINITNFNFIEGEFSLDKVQDLTDIFTTLLNQSDRIDQELYPNDPRITQRGTRDEAEIKQVLLYKYWVPVFQMHRLVQTEPQEKEVSLIAMGIPSKSNLDIFETFTYYPEEAEPISTIIEPGEPKILTYGDINIPIDSNWTVGDDGIVKLPIHSDHDAAITLRNMTTDGTLAYPGLHMAYLNLVINNRFIPAKSISIIKYDDRTVLAYDIYDENLGRYTSCHVMYFTVEDRVYIVTINAFKDLFDNNFQYFKKLIEETKVSVE